MAPHRDAIGAGVVVVLEPARLRVLTARHVADRGAVTIWVHGRPLPAEIVRTFSDRDLAVVDAFGAHLDRLNVRPATVGQAVSVGGDLVVWGENEEGLRIVRATLVSPAFQAPDKGQGVTLLSIACDRCAPGDSGGGIFDSAGRLLGILTARYYTRGDRTVAIVGEPIDPSMYAVTDSPVASTAGRSLPVIDTLNAATATGHGLTLVTPNTRNVESTGVPLVDLWQGSPESDHPKGAGRGADS